MFASCTLLGCQAKRCRGNFVKQGVVIPVWAFDNHCDVLRSDSGAVENKGEDLGGYPSDEQLAGAIEELGWSAE